MVYAGTALCLLVIGVGLLVLAILVSRAPNGVETPGVGFQRKGE